MDHIKRQYPVKPTVAVPGRLLWEIRTTRLPQFSWTGQELRFSGGNDNDGYSISLAPVGGYETDIYRVVVWHSDWTSIEIVALRKFFNEKFQGFYTYQTQNKTIAFSFSVVGTEAAIDICKFFMPYVESEKTMEVSPQYRHRHQRL